jgi:hypothetical protein
MDPHPEQDEQAEAVTPGRGGLITAVIIGAVVLILVVLHLIGAMALHGS